MMELYFYEAIILSMAEELRDNFFHKENRHEICPGCPFWSTEHSDIHDQFCTKPESAPDDECIQRIAIYFKKRQAIANVNRTLSKMPEV